MADFYLTERQPTTARQILENKWQEFVNQEINLSYQEQTWSVKLSDLGFQFDSLSTINQAYQIGRQSNFLINFKEQLAALVGIYNLEPIYQIEQEKFQEQTAELFKDIEKPVQNASLVFDEETDDFSLQEANQGTIISREKLLTDLSIRIKSFSNQPLILELITDQQPSVENDEVSLAMEKAREILADQPYRLILEAKTWTIDKKRLLDWMKFEPVLEDETDNLILGLSLDYEQVEEYLKEITSTINQYPINAHLETEGNRAVVFQPAQEGYGVDIDKTVVQLIQNISGENPVQKTTITAQKLLPKIALWQTNDLGINTLIGQGVSNFAGSPTNRIHNIKTGAAKFNGLILNPGEEFSFNTLLGGSGPEQGFLPELVIKKNKVVPEYGGGLCQVSTTVFRAAINSGLEITERKAHAFPVVYYSPQGFDATVYEPKPDLRFINDTSNHLLIQTIVQGRQLIFNFYGTADGRQIKIKGPYVLEKNEDGSMKAALTKEIYRDGQLVNEQTFYSNYDSPNLYPIEAE